jgi:hypothetical protein
MYRKSRAPALMCEAEVFVYFDGETSLNSLELSSLLQSPPKVKKHSI